MRSYERRVLQAYCELMESRMRDVVRFVRSIPTEELGDTIEEAQFVIALLLGERYLEEVHEEE